MAVGSGGRVGPPQMPNVTHTPKTRLDDFINFVSAVCDHQGEAATPHPPTSDRH